MTEKIYSTQQMREVRNWDVFLAKRRDERRQSTILQVFGLKSRSLLLSSVPEGLRIKTSEISTSKKRPKIRIIFFFFIFLPLRKKGCYEKKGLQNDFVNYFFVRNEFEDIR